MTVGYLFVHQLTGAPLEGEISIVKDFCTVVVVAVLDVVLVDSLERRMSFRRVREEGNSQAGDGACKAFAYALEQVALGP